MGSFAASYERFLELFIRIVMKTKGTDDDKLAKGWKKVSRQSERQLGAFIFLYLMEFGDLPPLLGQAQIELRNKVIHQGYFPAKDECVNYSGAVLDSIRQAIRVLDSSKQHQPELHRSINDQGNFSSDGPRVHCFAYPLIPTNCPPTEDAKTLEDMLKDAMRR